jgi:peptide/nickel transport system permease protein
VPRRLLLAVGRALLLLACVSFLAFAAVDRAPGDPLGDLRLDPRVSPATIARLRAQRWLDRPLPVRYAAWVRSVAAGDFGDSAIYGEPVRVVLAPRAARTLLLTGLATALAWCCALPLGAWAAATRGGLVDRLIGAGSSLVAGVPDVLLALVALWLAVGTGWFPAGGASSLDAELAGGLARWRDAAWHLVLPVAVLTLVLLPVLVRHVRTATLAALHTPALVAARARGVGGGRLVRRHALRLAAPSLAALAGLSLAGLLSGSLAVEVIMGWPGLGPLLLEATLARDAALVVAASTAAAALLAIGTLAGDALAWLFEPRLRAGDAT